MQKHRAFYAPLLVRLGNPLLRVLNTGVLILAQCDWEERERRVYLSLRRVPVRTDAGGPLLLPHLAGEPLAVLLEDPELDGSVRQRAVERAVVALAELHDSGYTHGDAMAENVLVDLQAGVAHWIDFETVHDPARPLAWRRADDVRALLVTCLRRTEPEELADTLRLVLDVYPERGVARVLVASFASVMQRPLGFHLAQAGLSLHRFRWIGRLLKARVDESGPGAG